MGTTLTTNYSFLKPIVGPAGDDDAWGGHVNTSLDSIDTQIKNRQNEAAAAQADATAALAAVGGSARLALAEHVLSLIHI